MSGKMSRNKGANGELEFLKLLQPVVDAVLGVGEVVLARNLMQTRDGGFDIAGLTWMALEVKRQEALSLGVWWEQTMQQASGGRLPILAYRQNNKKWKVRMLTAIYGIEAVAEYELPDFLRIFQVMLEVEAGSAMQLVAQEISDGARIH